jgi:hypothetical protein
MIVHPCTQVERRHAQLIDASKLEPDERVDDGERLNRLRRIKIETFLVSGYRVS